MYNFIGIRRNSTSSQDKLPVRIGMIHGISNGIPKLRHLLPLINEPRPTTLQQILNVNLRRAKILLVRFRICHIKDTLGNLLTCRRLSTPLRTFYQNCTNPSQLPSQQLIRNSNLI